MLHGPLEKAPAAQQSPARSSICSCVARRKSLVTTAKGLTIGKLWNKKGCTLTHHRIKGAGETCESLTRR